MKRRFAFALLTAFLAVSPLLAADLPPGKWWRRPEIVRELSLTEDQQSRLEGIFRQSANDLIDLKADVEKHTVALRGELDQTQLDRARIRAAAQRLNESRAKLFERELILLVDMRSVLSEQQWNQMRSRLNEFGQQVRPRVQRK